MTNASLPNEGTGTNSPKMLLAEYPDEHSLVAAARNISEQNLTEWDTYSPYPIHGIDEAMRIRPTRLPWVVLGGALVGGSTAMLLQWWTNAVDYPFLISGKPLFSVPSSIPVAFELSILFAAFAAFLGMLIFNRLPRLANPLLRSDQFRKVTTDGFFLSLNVSGDDLENYRKTLEQTNPSSIEELALVEERTTLPRPVVYGLWGLAALLLIPPVLIARARVTTSSDPRFHIYHGMEFQPKRKTQTTSELFEDGRSMRPPVPGTIARGDLELDTRYHRGLEPLDEMPRNAENPLNNEQEASEPSWVQDLPLKVTTELMQHGQERYNIFCSACHGLGGAGDGLVTQRALELEQGTWVKPIALYEKSIAEQPVGKLYNTITNGVRKMPGYASQIPPRDRWAIVLYLRALQRGKNATIEDVPQDIRPSLREVN